MTDQTSIVLNLLCKKINNLIKQSNIYVLPKFHHQNYYIREKMVYL